MAMNNRGLGRGFEALFDNANNPQPGSESQLRHVSLDSITPSGDQPRERFETSALEELAASIKKYGVLEPLLARPGENPDSYRLVAGERRLRAARIAGLSEVPVIVKPFSDEQALVITLLENLQREDLNPIEVAKGIEALRTRLNLTHDAIAEYLGKSRGSVTHALRLLKLPPAVQNEVAEGRLPTSHAKTIGGIQDEEALLRLAKRIIELGMTARETEEAVAHWNKFHEFPWSDEPVAEDAPVEKQRRPRKSIDPAIGNLADSLGAIFNCRAKIRGNQEKGTISLTYENNSQLFELLEKLGLTMDAIAKS